MGQDNCVMISGSHEWLHGLNSVKKHPKSIMVELLANGQMVKEQMITAKNSCCWSFQVPRYDDKGKVISYTIRTDKVEGYKCQIKDYAITSIHKSVELDEKGQPNGRFSEELSISLNLKKMICVGNVNGIWIIPKRT